jgi:hypothetical protein
MFPLLKDQDKLKYQKINQLELKHSQYKINKINIK